MRIITASAAKCVRSVSHDDVIIVPEFFCREDSLELYNTPLKEMREVTRTQSGVLGTRVPTYKQRIRQDRRLISACWGSSVISFQFHPIPAALDSIGIVMGPIGNPSIMIQLLSTWIGPKCRIAPSESPLGPAARWPSVTRRPVNCCTFHSPMAPYSSSGETSTSVGSMPSTRCPWTNRMARVASPSFCGATVKGPSKSPALLR